MIRLSIRNKIMGIAVTLVALMVITAVWTVALVMQVGTRIEEFAYSYVPAYGDLARANIRSLERGLTIRRIVIDKLQSPDDSSRQTALRDSPARAPSAAVVAATPWAAPRARPRAYTRSISSPRPSRLPSSVTCAPTPSMSAVARKRSAGFPPDGGRRQPAAVFGLPPPPAFDVAELPFPPALIQKLGLAMGAPLGRMVGYQPTYAGAPGEVAAATA